MTTIDRYVLRTFVSSYLLLLVVGVGLYVLGDVLFNFDEFTENRALSARDIGLNMVDFYGHNLPLYYQQLGGVVMALAASFTFGMMMRNNELTALVAAGVPLQRLAVPVLACAALLVGLRVANAELVLPTLAPKIARRHDDLGDTRRVEVHCVRDDRNAILSAAELRVRHGVALEVYLVEPDAQGEPLNLIRADAAIYDPSRRTWRLVQGSRLTMAAAFAGGGLGEAIHGEPLAEFAFTLAPEQVLLRQSAQWATLMSIRQMNQLLASENLPNLPAIAKARDSRFTQPLLTFILLMLATPFFLTCAPGSVLVAGGKALLLSGSCFAFAFIADSLPSTGALALLSTVLPVLIFGPVAVLHIANVRT